MLLRVFSMSFTFCFLILCDAPRYSLPTGKIQTTQVRTFHMKKNHKRKSFSWEHVIALVLTLCWMVVARLVVHTT